MNSVEVPLQVLKEGYNKKGHDDEKDQLDNLKLIQDIQ
jgi:hypothetical protein